MAAILFNGNLLVTAPTTYNTILYQFLGYQLLDTPTLINDFHNQYNYNLTNLSHK